MQWTLKQKGWRAILIRMGLLTVLWLVVAFVFATEFYLSARSDPIKIPWDVAVGSAFRDWFPWILLSPIAVILAGQFRFYRSAWRSSLIVHIAASVLFTFAYQGILMLAYPAPYFLSTGGMVGVSAAAPDGALPEPPNVGFFGGTSGLPAPAGSNAVVFEGGNIFDSDAGPWPVPAGAGTVIVTRTNGALSVERHAMGDSPGFRVGFRRFRSIGKWTSFFQMAMLKTQFTVPIYLCIVCVCWVVGHFQEAGERERRTLELEARLTEANLHALKMQLQPHFLFNTLNSISSLVHENPKAADDMIGSLSQFLRTTLEVSAKNEISLRQEFEFVDRYLEIQQMRFGQRLRIHREISPAVLDGLVPPLILQPLVENSIRYGVESRESGGTVTLCASREGAVLRLEISDDGEGFSGQMLGKGSGIGLSNTKARLQELYAGKHQFKITARHPAGACVMIEIPFRTLPPNTENRT